MVMLLRSGLDRKRDIFARKAYFWRAKKCTFCIITPVISAIEKCIGKVTDALIAFRITGADSSAFSMRKIGNKVMILFVS